MCFLGSRTQPKDSRTRHTCSVSALGSPEFEYLLRVRHITQGDLSLSVRWLRFSFPSTVSLLNRSSLPKRSCNWAIAFEQLSAVAGKLSTTQAAFEFETTTCSNSCGEEHETNVKGYKKYKEEVEILKIKVQQEISRNEAVEKFQREKKSYWAKTYNDQAEKIENLEKKRKTTQLSRRKTTRLGSRNETTRQQEKTTQTRQQERNNSTLYFRRPPTPPLQQNWLFLPTNIKR
ncbi:hypothetical protein TNCV_3814101 [Trichonephila clavipes]|nr:hypothetical protein TNCV_3814101 [Trichonephila clavipes]